MDGGRDDSQMPSDLTSADSPPAFVPVARPVRTVSTTLIWDANPLLLRTMSRADALADSIILLVSLVGMWVFVPLILLGAISEPSPTIGVVMTGAFGLCSIVIVGLMLRRRGQSLASVGLCIREGVLVFPVALLAVAGAFAILLVHRGILYYTSSPDAFGQNAEQLSKILPPMQTWVILVTMLIVGTYEEIIFRGFLLTRIRRATNSRAVAIITTSTLFALAHAGDQQWLILPGLFGIAVFWSVLAFWRKSIVPIIIGHAVFNSIQLWSIQNLPQVP